MINDGNDNKRGIGQDGSSRGSSTIVEGIIKKGGTNPAPSSQRPQAPTGQGGGGTKSSNKK